MLDFRELPENGQAFEQLVREIVFSHGLHVQWSGVGPDGGRDLICDEKTDGLFAQSTRRWLVQCKHFAHAGRSVGIVDLDDIVDSCTQHGATGYLLACSTQPSSAVVQRLESITANPANQITAAFWDGVTLERLVSVPRRWAIAQRFFPVSAGDWRIYATERPNDFVAHYKGHVFHLSNRIGSMIGHQLPTVALRFEQVNALRMREGHFFRFRSVFYDDKNGVYTGYIDYMRPNGEAPQYSAAEILNLLEDGSALDDGQVFYWDVRSLQYSPYSDHYDKDHYDYYVEYMPNYLEGSKRHDAAADFYAIRQQIEELDHLAEARRDTAFRSMVDVFAKLPFLSVMRSVNCAVEDIHRFERRIAWTKLASAEHIDLENLFTALVVVRVKDESELLSLLAKFPLPANASFRAARVRVFVPGKGLSEADGPIYDIRFSVRGPDLDSRDSARKAFDGYFDKVRSKIEEHLAAAKESSSAPSATGT